MAPLEREFSLASLAEYANDARAGHGRLALVAGPAGAGKSTLVKRLRSDLPGARWAWGACENRIIPSPLAPAADLAGQLAGGRTRLWNAGTSREEIFDDLLARIDDLDAPAVLVIEDLQWADDATLDLVEFLARRIELRAVLVIVTVSDEGRRDGDPVGARLRQLATQPATRRIELAPLSRGAVRVLAGGTGIDADELHRHSGGNPFYVSEVIRAGSSTLPTSMSAAALAGLAGLSGESRDLIDVAALIGPRIEPAVVQAVSGCPPSTLDELVAAALLVREGAWLRFGHEITRVAVQDAIATHRRAHIHARILATLQSLGVEDDARLAGHAEAADDNSAVLRYAPRAARAAAKLACHRQAAAQYQRAQRAAGGASAAAQADLAAQLSFHLAQLARPAAAGATGREAAQREADQLDLARAGQK